MRRDPTVGMGKDRGTIVFDAAGHRDAKARLADMDDDGVDASVNYCEVSSFRYLYLIDDGWQEATRAFNDDAGATSPSADPKRLIVSYQIPIHDIDAAVAEVQWAAVDRLQVAAAPGVPGRARPARLLGRSATTRCSPRSRTPTSRSAATSA